MFIHKIMPGNSETEPPFFQHFCKQYGLYISITVIVILHFIGLIGINLSDYRDRFLLLTPFNLLITAFLLFLFHGRFNRPFWYFAVGIFIAGIAIEIAGVKTGIIFGHYYYGIVLGPKVLETPWIIGLNWLILIYSTGNLANKLPIPLWGKIGIAALLMVLLDWLIEPVAICFGFWYWENNTIPIQNYIAWYAVSVAMHFFFYKSRFPKNNPLSVWVYIVQVVFFAGNQIWQNC